METPDVRAEAKRVLDELPDERLMTALELLHGLRNQEPPQQLDVTEVYPWTQVFSESDLAEFLAELLYATKQVIMSGNWGVLEDIIDAWQETAEILADDELVARLEETETQIQRGETIPWSEVKERLHIS